MSAQSLRYAYSFIVADYLDFVKSLLGVPDLRSENVCTELEFSPRLFFSLAHLRYLGVNNLCRSIIHY